MRFRLFTIGAVLALPAAALAAGEQYAWSISASTTDPFVQTGAPLPEPGVLQLGLWLVCHEGDGIAAAEFDVHVTGDLMNLGFQPIEAAPGGAQVFNLGGTGSLLLGIGGCPRPPFLAGTLLFVDLGNGGTACLGPSAANGLNVSVDCGFPQPTAFPNGVLGFSSDGSPPCVIGDCVDPVVSAGDNIESSTWGRIKGVYR